MKRVSLSIGIVSFGVQSLMLFAQVPEEDYRAYTIPSDARRVERSHKDGADVEYYPKDAKADSGPMIGREGFTQGELVVRETFKDGKLHGIRRTWHMNGTLESEEPYRNGLRHGTFRHFDKAGRLVGQYLMVEGSGQMKFYNSDGVLIHDETFVNNLSDGVCVTFSDGIRVLTWRKQGRNLGMGPSFYPDHSVHTIGWWGPKDGMYANIHGPILQFDPDGRLSGAIKWFVNGAPVSEKEYEQSTKVETNLPPYNSDPAFYKSLVGPDVKAILTRYDAMPKVRIPLELDGKGIPIPAP